MTNLRLLSISVFVIVSCLQAYADPANSAFKRGMSAEAKNDYDQAFESYKQAHEAKPKDPKYFEAYLRARFYAANEHVRSGQLLRDAGKVEEALAEFNRAAEIDRSNFLAQQELRRTNEMLRKQKLHQEAKATPQSPLAKIAEEADGPVELRPLPNTLTNLRMTESADKVYRILGKLAGINVLFDSDYKPQKINVELNDVTPREALNLVAMQTKTFWQPVSPNTIFVASDTVGKRKELQNNVMKTFYLKNVSSAAELQEAANTVRGILDVSRVQLVPTQSAIVMRGTSAQMVLAEKLFADIDKPKSEVVIDIAVMQISRDHLNTIGVNPPTSATISMVPTTGVSGAGSGSSFTINQLGNITANNFQVTIPNASLTLLMSDSNTKLIQNPEIRALDNEKATLKIGDRVPISTGSFQSGLGGGVNTQFQYLDVGVNIDITPHVHSEGEVTLKMVLEISSVTGSQNIGGINQPIIGQRRIEHDARLQDGEVNLIGGILEDSETQSLSGYPWIAKVPILKYLFGQETKDRRENEIVFAITPHIIRSRDLDDQNQRLVDVGNGTSIDVRRRASTSSEANSASPATAPAATSPTVAKPSVQGAPADSKLSKNVAKNLISSAQVPLPPRIFQNVPQSKPTSPPSQANVLPSRASSAQPVRTGSDPCPDGQHLVQQEGNVAVCAFN